MVYMFIRLVGFTGQQQKMSSLVYGFTEEGGAPQFVTRIHLHF